MADSRGRVWTGVLRVEPHRGDHRVALRAAISVAVPLLVLWMLGRLDLSIYASFGAFAALYGRHDVFRDRLRMQATAGGVILASMLVGTALSVLAAPAPVSILVVAVIASAVTLLAYTMRWHPPGPLFPVFAVGACATIPATTASFGDVLLVGGPSVLFGLAMDYQMFLVTGMREAHAHGQDARDAVVTGFRHGRRVVTAAALIMASVFAGFIWAELTMIRPIGFGMAVGVLLDAFIVRMTLTPAVMRLLGEKAWWIPRWLDRILPDVDVEGAKLDREQTS